MSQTDKQYFRSIDGLRAVAVIAVLFFHVDFQWFKGGFVGVDIFFVISGFLITGNILRELDDGRWSFKRFYLKRIARLFPASFTVVLTTLFFSYYILSPDDLERIGRVAIYSILSFSNILFWWESGYFDQSAAFKPLLHTWSLSVEEQFYLFWPLLVSLLFLLKRKKHIAIVLVLISIISIIVAVFIDRSNPSTTFFLTPFRTYQFAFGGIISIIGLKFNRKYAFAGAISSLAVILFFVTYSDGESGGTLNNSFLPTIATALFIYYSENSKIKYIFSSLFLTWIGRRSYSIYLVHWPIIVLWKMKTDLELDTFEKIFAILISIILGSILYSGVENKFRIKDLNGFTNKSFVVAGLLSFITLIVGSHFWGFDGFPHRVPNELKQITKGLSYKWQARQKLLRTGECNMLFDKDTFDMYNISKCSKPPPGKRSLFIIGDSYASGTYLIFSKAYPDIYFGQMTLPGCRLRPLDSYNKNQRLCKEFYQMAFEKLLDDGRYEGVILSSNWMDGHLYEIEDIIRKLKKMGLDVYLIGPRMKFKDRVPSIVMSSMSLLHAKRKSNALIKNELNGLNNKIKTRFVNQCKFIDIMSLQCLSDYDIVDSKGKLIYLDNSHFSLEGVGVIANRLKNHYPNLFNIDS